MEIIGILEEIFIPILIHDRSLKIKGKSGLDFLISDKAIREQMIIYLQQFRDDKQKNIQLTISIENHRYIMINDKKMWTDFFKLKHGDIITEEDEKEIIKFMKKYFTPFESSRSHSLGLDDWQRLNKWMNEQINEILEEHFTGDGEKSMKTKLKKYLSKINFGAESSQKRQSFISLFDENLTIIFERLFQNGGVLFRDHLTKADLYLFSVFVQYFEGPLQNEDLKNYFLLKSEINKNKYFGKGKEKIEDLNEIIEVKEEKGENTSNVDEYNDLRIQLIYEFVEKIKNV
uniref:GST C-terminal domain-containing protein n=1 Tax=Meloidogyne hapla TaxID=6305 RepID=A0A1I8BS59_MELHA